MTNDKLVALLGRPLTPTETSNLPSYKDIAEDNAQALLCMSIASDPYERTYTGREGYSTIFTDLFTEIDEVKIDDEVIDPSEYFTAFWDNRNSTLKNSIVFKDTPCDGKDVVISANWGGCLPDDLKRLLARAYAQSVAKKPTTNVTRKTVEDFSVWYGDLSTDEVFMNENAAVIRKYSLCSVGNIRHGSTC